MARDFPSNGDSLSPVHFRLAVVLGPESVRGPPR